MAKITIRQLSATTVRDYHSIRLEALQRSPEAFGSLHEVEATRPMEAFEERLTTSIVLGAYFGEQIIGTAGLAPGSGPKERHKGFLWGMYVRSDMRRQGVGAALVDAVVNCAPAAIEQITLTVVQGNKAAHALYARFGFTIYGVEQNALKTENRYLDETLMVKFLRLPAASAQKNRGSVDFNG